MTNGGFTNTDVEFNATDLLLGVVKLYTANYSVNNGTPISFKGQSVTVNSDGLYTIVAADASGNSSTASFTIDKTAPSISLTGATDGGFTKTNVSVKFSDTNLKSANYTLNSSSSTSFATGPSFYKEVIYKFTVLDKAGNSSTASFTIDKTAPTVSLNGVTNGGFTNTDVVIFVSDTYISTSNYSLNNSTSISFNSEITLSSDGSYSVHATDLAGNSTSYTFTIDKTAPTISLKGVANG